MMRKLVFLPLGYLSLLSEELVIVAVVVIAVIVVTFPLAMHVFVVPFTTMLVLGIPNFGMTVPIVLASPVSGTSTATSASGATACLLFRPKSEKFSNDLSKGNFFDNHFSLLFS
jgi:hypothetical protein